MCNFSTRFKKWCSILQQGQVFFFSDQFLMHMQQKTCEHPSTEAKLDYSICSRKIEYWRSNEDFFQNLVCFKLNQKIHSTFCHSLLLSLLPNLGLEPKYFRVNALIITINDVFIIWHSKIALTKNMDWIMLSSEETSLRLARSTTYFAWH